MKALLFKTLLLFTCVFGSSYSFATTHIINTADFSFSPSSLSIMLGDTVQWVYVSGSHTTTSTTIPTGATAWNSPINTTVTSYTYVPTVSGTYNYICVPHQGMGMTGSFVVSGTTSVGIVAAATPVVSPNPASSVVHIQTDAQALFVSLTDLTGRYIPLQQIGNTTKEKIFSVENIPAGVYFVMIKEENKITTQKLLIAR